jgi:glycosyltransferase involved in cell wall biosynthesis
MRVAFDLTAVGIDRGGSGVHATLLAAALGSQDDLEFVPVAFPWLQPPSPQRSLGDRARTILRDVWWTQSGVERAARRASADLLHVPVALGPIHGRLPLVVTVHDLFVLTMPERFRGWMRTSMGYSLPRLLRRADAIIASSGATRDDIMRVLAVPSERIHVVGSGADPRFGTANAASIDHARSTFKLPARFILAVGQVESRKNLARLIRAVLEARQLPGCDDLVLIHVGAEGWHADDVRDALALPGARDAVRFLGYRSTDEIVALYAAATALAFPSLGEGFGIPLVEAMASGLPILTSPNTSLPEVAGDAAIYRDPTDVGAISDGLAALWTDRDLRHSLIDAGKKRISRFRWDAIARATAQVYQRVLG